MPPRKHVAILPSSIPTIETAQRFLRLPHPRTRQPSLFLPQQLQPSSSTIASTSALSVHGDRLLEVQAIQTTEKSKTWFVNQEIVSDGNLTMITSIDPVFLIISFLTILSRTSSAKYRTLADTFEAISLLPFAAPLSTAGASKDVDGGDETEYSIGEDAIRLGALDCVQKRLIDICETQEYDGIPHYRISSAQVLALLKLKIDNLTNPDTGIFGPFASESAGLGRPPSTEELENLGTESTRTSYPTITKGLLREGAGDGVGTSQTMQLEMRQKSAIQIISNYLPTSVAATLLTSYSFPNLTVLLETTTVSSVLSTTYLPGRASSFALGDPMATSNGFGAAAAAAKKRKLDSKGSRGVEALKKTSIRGMKTLSEMFAKPAAKKK